VPRIISGLSQMLGLSPQQHNAGDHDREKTESPETLPGTAQSAAQCGRPWAASDGHSNGHPDGTGNGDEHHDPQQGDQSEHDHVTDLARSDTGQDEGPPSFTNAQKADHRNQHVPQHIPETTV